jgi:hypothetical protein
MQGHGFLAISSIFLEVSSLLIVQRLWKLDFFLQLAKSQPYNLDEPSNQWQEQIWY